jgi:ParB-like chromosome segregation protein Spo0J
MSLILDIYRSMKQSQIGWQVLKRKLPYEYVRLLFAELTWGNLPEEEVEEFLDEEIQREHTWRLLAHGAEVGTDLEVDVDDLEVDPIPSANLDDYVVPTPVIAEVCDSMGDTRELLADMGDEVGKPSSRWPSRSSTNSCRTPTGCDEMAQHLI